MTAIPQYYVSYQTTLSEFWVLASRHGGMRLAIEAAEEWMTLACVIAVRIIEVVVTTDAPQIQIVAWFWS